MAIMSFTQQIQGTMGSSVSIFARLNAELKKLVKRQTNKQTKKPTFPQGNQTRRAVRVSFSYITQFFTPPPSTMQTRAIGIYKLSHMWETIFKHIQNVLTTRCQASGNPHFC